MSVGGELYVQLYMYMNVMNVMNVCMRREETANILTPGWLDNPIDRILQLTYAKLFFDIHVKKTTHCL